MPLIQTKNGCWKYGEGGHEYCGKNAKKKAAKQGAAIEIQKHRTSGEFNFKNFVEFDTAEMFDVIFDYTTAVERRELLEEFKEYKNDLRDKKL